MAIVRTYCAEPGTCWTEPPSIEVIASSFVPRWPSPKLVNAVANVKTTGMIWKRIRKMVPGTRYLIGMCQGCR